MTNQESEPILRLTAFESLQTLMPQILKWKKDAYLVTFQSLSSFLDSDGRTSEWSFYVESPKSRKIAVFTLKEGKAEVLPTKGITDKELENYWDLQTLETAKLIDSDALAKRLPSLGIPSNSKGQFLGHFGGGGRLIPNLDQKFLWQILYYDNDGWEWLYFLDMLTGEILKHFRGRKPFEAE